MTDADTVWEKCLFGWPATSAQCAGDISALSAAVLIGVLPEPSAAHASLAGVLGFADFPVLY